MRRTPGGNGGPVPPQPTGGDRRETPASGALLARPKATAPHLATGLRAEALAAAYLESRGLRIVVRNWRRPGGEIDLIADDDGTCVFVEVRARTGEEHGHPLEAVNPRKRARVVRAARLYLAEETPRAIGFRFDVVGVLFSTGTGGDAAEATCFHVANAFDVEGG